MLKSIKDKYRIRFGQTHNYADIQDNAFCQALDEAGKIIESKNREIQELKDLNNKNCDTECVNHKVYYLEKEVKELREQLESIEEHEMKMARNPIEDDCVDHCQEIAVLNKQIADLKAELASDDDLYKYSHCCFDHDYSWKDNKMIAEKEDCPKCLKAELQEAKKRLDEREASMEDEICDLQNRLQAQAKLRSLNEKELSKFIWDNWRDADCERYAHEICKHFGAQEGE